MVYTAAISDQRNNDEEIGDLGACYCLDKIRKTVMQGKCVRTVSLAPNHFRITRQKNFATKYSAF
jgi:hypothetical protein